MIASRSMRETPKIASPATMTISTIDSAEPSGQSWP
jgi:hypothetical protein